MEEQTFHTINNKSSLASHTFNHDKNVIDNENNISSINIIDEESVQALNKPNPANNFYGVVWILFKII